MMNAVQVPLAQSVRAAVARLVEAGVPSAEHDAIALAAHAAGVDAGEIRRRMALGHESPAGLEELVDERARRVPLQHLTGHAAFRTIELSVGPGVFVPRPETETVVDRALEAIDELADTRQVEPVVVDLCSGSGAIALSIKAERPQTRVHAVEVSAEAFAWLERNRDELGLDVELHHDDATRALPELDALVDVVVSNPPYIPSGQVPIDPEVRDHDPSIALYGGSADGLAIPRLVAARAASLLRPGGVLVMEHADAQGATLPTALLGTGSWSQVIDRQDLSGRPRCVVAVRADED
ncbi:MAG: peptide chain release factor N(5)-glutamine methyltransferase [Micrococcales bacterium]|nr:peptide chain release factor N(5)-glutamine methyltransferase [Micrococcales bacterium]